MPLPKFLLVIALLSLSNYLYADCSHDSFDSYKVGATIGFYTGLSAGESDLCKSIEIDHVVSLKEARDRGLPNSRCGEFANDKENHVAACISINRSKQDAGPVEFLRRSCDGKNKEYAIINWEEYLHIYYKILHKYDLLKTGIRKQSTGQVGC